MTDISVGKSKNRKFQGQQADNQKKMKKQVVQEGMFPSPDMFLKKRVQEPCETVMECSSDAHWINARACARTRTSKEHKHQETDKKAK